MNIKEKAKIFAIKAHKGQIRKSEPDKPMIIHPISVGLLLEEYGYDDEVIAAGFLHDVVEDTKYTLEDIKKEFGSEIASLVKSASEPDKSLSWEERKKHTIETSKNLPLRNKVVICADKINNLEDLMIKFEKNGKRDFNAFKRGEESQKWYYTSIYESLITNEDENLPIFKRFKEVLDKVFPKKEDSYLKDTIFANHQEDYENRKRLHAQKLELEHLKALCHLVKPFVIEFSGTPRTGKTTTIKDLYDFFKKGGFDITIIEEFTTSKQYKEQLRSEFSKMTLKDRNIAIIELIYKQLLEAIKSKRDIILIDRSLNDRQIWNYERYRKKDISETEYQELKEKYRVLSRKLIDFLVITYANPLTSLKRDYLSSLALEPRSFLNIQNIEEYNQSLNDLKPLFQSSTENVFMLDTTNLSLNEVATSIANQIMPAIRQRYLKSIKEEYHLD